MVFDAEKFAASPNEAQFQVFKKLELLRLARHFNLEVRVNMKKAEMQTLVIESLVGQGTWTEVALDWLPEENENVELRKLEMQLQSQERLKAEERKAEKERAGQERELEERRAEEKAEERRAARELEERRAEERRVERELEERREKERAEERRAERELKERDMECQREIKLKELELMRERGEVASMPAGSTTSQNTWDVGKHVRLVPLFNEKEVAKFFLHFEKVAQMLKWPVESWTMLVQSVLVGKAQDIFSALPIDQCADYEIAKKPILKAYELVPEAYWQKFWNARKRESETHVEFLLE
uniref:uncharacterized protein n=1 Tax=Myxine glutinosa TaxID=7769 RepID=UPI00358E9720